MDFLKQREKIKKTVEDSKKFSIGYKWANIFLTLLSYLGNVAAIYLAYFFLSKILIDVLGDLMPVFLLIGVSVIFLTLFELLKRYLFDKISKTLLFEKLKKIEPEFYVIFSLSLVIVAASFYFTIQGAKDVADKGEKIVKLEENNVSSIKDSLVKTYDIKLKSINKDVEDLKSSNKNIEEDIKLEANTWSKNMLRANINQNNISISKLREDIEKIEKRRDSTILAETKKIESKTVNLKEDNQSRTKSFIILSFFIEFLILTGIVFKNYYIKKSYEEFNKMYESNSKFKKLELFEEYLNILYKDGKLSVNDVGVSRNDLSNIADIRGYDTDPKIIKEFVELTTYLNITKTDVNKTYLLCSLDDAKEKLRTELLNSK